MITNPQELRIPGNLLLAGEYSLMMQGGLGIGFSLNRYAYARLEPSKEFHFSGHACGIDFNPCKTPFLQDMIDQLEQEFQGLPPVHIELDSSEFYHHRGFKLGFGSSAATALSLTWAFFKAFRHEWSKRELYDCALKIYRNARESLVSGYDLAVSLYGGLILFTGGERPEIEELDLPWFPSTFGLIFSGHSVDSSQAVARFRRLPEEVQKGWMLESNRLIRQLLTCPDYRHAYRVLREYRRLSSVLGQKLDVPVEHIRFRGRGKALGAGNEVFWKYKPGGNASSFSLDREGMC